MRWISLPLWAVWLLFGFCYYGIILFVTRVYSKPNPDGSESCSFDYEDVFINSIAEFVGTLKLTNLIHAHMISPSQSWRKCKIS
jgi:hypothetical protein